MYNFIDVFLVHMHDPINFKRAFILFYITFYYFGIIVRHPILSIIDYDPDHHPVSLS